MMMISSHWRWQKTEQPMLGQARARGWTVLGSRRQSLCDGDWGVRQSQSRTVIGNPCSISLYFHNIWRGLWFSIWNLYGIATLFTLFFIHLFLNHFIKVWLTYKELYIFNVQDNDFWDNICETIMTTYNINISVSSKRFLLPPYLLFVCLCVIRTLNQFLSAWESSDDTVLVIQNC